MPAQYTGAPATSPQGREHLIGALLQETLNRRRIEAIVALAWNGPQLWVYSCILGFGVDPERVERSAGALALAAGAEACRISRAAGQLLIEIPKPGDARQSLPPARLDALAARSPTTIAAGVTTGGHLVWIDLADPNACHLAIGGATGSGKSVLLHWLLYRLCRQNAPQSLRLLLLDPKGYELAPFAAVPHLLHPVTSNALECARLLGWVAGELDRRCNLPLPSQRGRGWGGGPRLVIVVDEVRDLVQTNPDIAPLLARIAQIGRGLGVHLIVSTQQPGGRSLGEALPNLPARLIGRVASATLTYGAAGRGKTMADQLLGKGDFLLLSAGGEAVRLQVPLIGDEQYRRLPHTERVATLNDQLPALARFVDTARDPRGGAGRRDLADAGPGADYQALDQALAGGATVTDLRERFNIGYTRAARIHSEYHDHAR